jgi:hypothetical protein
MANPGPATTVTTNYQPVNNQQALVLIGFIKGQAVSAAGDFLMPIIGPVTNFVPTVVVTTNSSGATVNIAAATVGIYTQPAAGGTAVLTTAALTGQTTNAFAYVRAATAVAAQVITSQPNLYVNIVTTVAAGITDIYLYGYNVS